MAGKKANSECAQMWARKAVSVHGDTYDYSESKYINARTKVKIRCKKHGFFYQLPHHHNYGNGCPECKREAISRANRKKPKPINLPSGADALPWPISIMDQCIRGRNTY